MNLYRIEIIYFNYLRGIKWKAKYHYNGSQWRLYIKCFKNEIVAEEWALNLLGVDLRTNQEITLKVENDKGNIKSETFKLVAIVSYDYMFDDFESNCKSSNLIVS